MSSSRPIDESWGVYLRSLASVKQAVLSVVPTGASHDLVAALARTVDDLTDRLLEVMARSDEPAEGVVMFTRLLGNGQYDYVAFRAADGYWYVTGEQQRQTRYSWYQLLGWADDGRGSLHTFRVPSSWVPLEVTRP